PQRCGAERETRFVRLAERNEQIRHASLPPAAVSQNHPAPDSRRLTSVERPRRRPTASAPALSALPDDAWTLHGLRAPGRVSRAAPGRRRSPTTPPTSW